MYKIRFMPYRESLAPIMHRQTKGHSLRSLDGRYQFFLDEQCEEPDFWVVQGKGVRHDQTCRVAPENTIMLTTLAGAGIGSMAAKVITEITFFMISWLVQQYVIFYREAEQKSAEDQAEENADHGSRHFTIGYAAVRPKRLREAYRKNIG